ncbi:MAG: hypothetical protein Q7T81_15950 [Pseudolabrys sp.]|nr:hypothetical protein [Pseudolabrys sp.]
MTFGSDLQGANGTLKVQPASRGVRVGLVVGTAVCVGLAGALPHLFFSFDTGKLNFFENAWDESFYALVMSGKVASWNDYPIRVLEQLFLVATNGPNFISALLSDMIWPAAVVMAAGFLALTIVRGWVAVVPALFCIIFASDIFAFNSSIIHPSFLTISGALKLLSVDVRKLFSDSFVPFLYLYRTPEPQLSLPFFFLYFALIIRFFRQGNLKLKDWILLSCGALICVLIYPFFATASLILGGLCAVALLLARRGRAGFGVLGITAICAVLFAFLLMRSHSGEASATRFASSLPMLAPSLIYSLILLPAFAWHFRHKLGRDAELHFALLCYLVPFATLNQQIVTGMMFQTVNWERYINYPCLVVATVILVGRADWSRLALWKPRVAGYVVRGQSSVFGIRTPLAGAAILMGLLALFLYRAQLNSYRQFAYYNLVTLAYANSVDQYFSGAPNAPRRVTLDNASYDAPVRVRLRTPDVSFQGYVDIVAALKTPDIKMGAPASAPSSIHREWGFEHAARLGLSRAQYEAKLIAEIDSGACWPELMFHFSFLECAPYVSDFRTYFPAKLKQSVSSIGDGYQRYLLARGARHDAADDALVLSMVALPGDGAQSSWTQKPAGEIQVATKAKGFAPNLAVKLYAYWQSARR